MTVLHARASWRRLRDRPTDPEPIAAYRKLFIVGCPRSGTTWIKSIVSKHPLAISAEESHAYTTVLGPFVDRDLKGDAGWRIVLTRYDLIAAQGWRVGLHRYVRRRALCRFILAARSHRDWSDERAAENVVRWIFDGFFAARGGTNRHVFVEKTPDHLFHGERILRMFPEARIIEVIRDGRDVCASMERVARTHWWPPRDRARQAAAWSNHIERGIALRTNPEFRGRVHQVRYEAVRDDPARAVAGILAFAGMESSPREIAEIVEATDVRNERNNRVRADGLGRGGWQAIFTPEDVAVFSSVAGDVLRQVGYDG